MNRNLPFLILFTLLTTISSAQISFTSEAMTPTPGDKWAVAGIYAESCPATVTGNTGMNQNFDFSAYSNSEDTYSYQTIGDMEIEDSEFTMETVLPSSINNLPASLDGTSFFQSWYPGSYYDFYWYWSYNIDDSGVNGTGYMYWDEYTTPATWDASIYYQADSYFPNGIEFNESKTQNANNVIVSEFDNISDSTAYTITVTYDAFGSLVTPWGAEVENVGRFVKVIQEDYFSRHEGVSDWMFQHTSYLTVIEYRTANSFEPVARIIVNDNWESGQIIQDADIVFHIPTNVETSQFNIDDKKLALEVSPNPAIENVNLVLPSEFSGEVEFFWYDMQGKLVSREIGNAVRGGAVDLDTPLQNGIYNLTVVNDELRVNQKVAVLR